MRYMKKITILIGIVVLAIAVVILFTWLQQQSTIITLFITARGDYVDPGPIEAECQGRMEQYSQSSEFKNKGFSECNLIESKVGSSVVECPNGLSPQGCSICKLECK